MQALTWPVILGCVGVLCLATGVVVPRVTTAQPTSKIYRVGFLSFAACDRPVVMPSFREGLRELGYAEGQNIVVDCRSGPYTTDRLTEVAAELVRLKVDVIVAESTALALVAKRATSTIPIVAVYVSDPVGSGLVATLARPGGNVTGLSVFSAGIVQKAFEMLREISPRVARVAVFMDPTNPGQTILDAQLDEAAKLLGITPQRIDVRNSTKFDEAFATTLRQHMQAIFVYPLPITPFEREKVVDFAIKHRLPTAAITPEFAESGMLVAYGVSGAGVFRRAATYVDKILKGAKPADLPVEQPTKFELVINMKAAKALGLTIPPSLLLRADQVIE